MIVKRVCSHLRMFSGATYRGSTVPLRSMLGSNQDNIEVGKKAAARAAVDEFIKVTCKYIPTN